MLHIKGETYRKKRKNIQEKNIKQSMGNQQNYPSNGEGGEFVVVNRVTRGGLIEQMTLSKDLKKVRRLEIWIYRRKTFHVPEAARTKKLRQECDWCV